MKSDFLAIARGTGLLLVVLAIMLLLPVPVAIVYGSGGAGAFVRSSVISCVIGMMLWFGTRTAGEKLSSRGAILLIILSWLVICIFGALPFYLSGVFPSTIDSIFESVSGFTTTGASIATDIEALPHSILFWRSLTHFVGGMGIVVLTLAIFPLLRIGTYQLYQIEASGITPMRLTPRILDTARIICSIYLLLNVVETALLYWAGMSWFDAANHAMSTIATGGYSTKNASVAAFESPLIEWIIICFMFLSGMNFALHFRLFVKREGNALKNPEFQFYTLLMWITIMLISLNIWGTDTAKSWGEAFRLAAFNTVSMMTCTGFATADFAKWAPFAQSAIILLAAIGGCAGSTSGGLKCIRLVGLFKIIYAELVRLLSRRSILRIKLEDAPISERALHGIQGLFVLYCITFTISTLFITATGVDLVTATSAVISCLSNCGPGLGEVGPVLNYAALPALAKSILMAAMVIGRLEITAALVLFTYTFWTVD